MSDNKTKDYQIAQAKSHYEAWKHSELNCLEKAYGKYSSKKAAAWEHCVALCEKCNGSRLRVITKNADMFTAGFVYEMFETKKFMYISPNFTISIEV